ncbi:MAG: hypothetical protein HFG54_02380 [Lachnospiraceae bacterium]|jgi:hypothetical protein|nr:hypothetical protein [Lachnospiraceae bacterium]
MHKSQKILAGIFLGGILLGGIGTGVALVEYSSLAYGGEKEIGQENLVVQELDYTFDPMQEKIRIIRGYQDRDAMVETDRSVPEGTVRYVVTYNKRTIRPTLSFWEDSPEEEEPGETDKESEEKQAHKVMCLQMETDYIGNDFGLMMENKDRILADLKEKKISSYHVAYVTDVRILVNPQTISSIQGRSREHDSDYGSTSDAQSGF